MNRVQLVNALRKRSTRSPLLRTLTELAEENDADLFWVGGGVRDAALRRRSADLDLLVTSGSRRLIGAIRRRWDTKGFSFRKRGVTTWRFRLGNDPLDLVVAERRGLAGDLARRELTLNAMAFSLRDGKLHDPHDGLSDLRRKRLRAVHGDSFNDDPLRALRVARFLAALPGFEATPATLRAAEAQTSRLARVSTERIRDELHKLLLSPRPDRGLDLLQDWGLQHAVLPELSPLHQCVAGQQRPDVWRHTLLTLREMGRRRGLPGMEQLDTEDQWARVGWSLLLHDIAKPATLARKPDGSPSFHGHEVLGAKMADTCLQRLRCSRSLRRDVTHLIRWHLRPGLLADGPRTLRGLRRLATEAGPLLPLLTVHAAADARGSGSPDPAERMERLVATLEELLETGHKLTQSSLQRPVDGNDVMRICGVASGRAVGRILQQIDELVLDGRIGNRRQGLAYLRKLGTAT